MRIIFPEILVDNSLCPLYLKVIFAGYKILGSHTPFLSILNMQLLFFWHEVLCFVFFFFFPQMPKGFFPFHYCSLILLDCILMFVLVNLGCCNKLPQTGWLTQHLFLTILEAGSPRSQCQHGKVLGEGPFSWLQMEPFLLCPHIMEREMISLLSFLLKTLILLIRVPPS